MVAGPSNYKVYSRFARDSRVFLYLVDKVLFRLARRAALERRGALRIWSAGCAGGEEPYSLAVAWTAALAEIFPTVRLEILGTDSDAASLERAKKGVFNTHAVSELPPEWIAKCFAVEEDVATGRARYTLETRVRESVRFELADARSTAFQGPFDLVLCRYSLFLYLPKDESWAALASLAPKLAPGGYLVTGLSDKLPQGYDQLGFRKVATRGSPDCPEGLPPEGFYRTTTTLENGHVSGLDDAEDDDDDEDEPTSLSEVTLGRKAKWPRVAPPKTRPIPRPKKEPPAPMVRPQVVIVEPKPAVPTRQSFKARPLPALYSFEDRRTAPPSPTPKKKTKAEDYSPPPPRPAAKRVDEGAAAAFERLARHRNNDTTTTTTTTMTMTTTTNKPAAADDNEARAPYPKGLIISAEDSDLLFERLLADVVRRERAIQDMRREAFKGDESPSSRRLLPLPGLLTARRLSATETEAFVRRMRRDADERKRRLLELQDAAAPRDERPEVREARRSLRILAAAPRPPLVSIAPSLLVRFALKKALISPAVAPDSSPSSSSRLLLRTASHRLALSAEDGDSSPSTSEHASALLKTQLRLKPVGIVFDATS